MLVLIEDVAIFAASLELRENFYLLRSSFEFTFEMLGCAFEGPELVAVILLDVLRGGDL